MASATHAVSPAKLATRSLRRPAPRVDILGIGAQKAGTTWLHQMLGAHPDVFMARADDKDLRFFSAYYDCGYSWYERHFAEDGGALRRGEFSTSYLYCMNAPERAHRYNPEMRLIVSLREPVARVISQHKHEIRVGRLATNVSLERGIEDNPSYVEQSMYFTQLSRWLEWFPRTAIHVVIFEELFVDPSRAIRDLYDFVGVSPSFVPDALHTKVNEGHVPRSRLLDHAIKGSASALRAVGAGRLVDSLKRAGVAGWAKKSNSRSASEAAIDPALLERLRAEFSAENAKLAALLGRDLSIWSSGARGRAARSCTST